MAIMIQIVLKRVKNYSGSGLFYYRFRFQEVLRLIGIKSRCLLMLKRRSNWFSFCLLYIKKWHRCDRVFYRRICAHYLDALLHFLRAELYQQLLSTIVTHYIDVLIILTILKVPENFIHLLNPKILCEDGSAFYLLI